MTKAVNWNTKYSLNDPSVQWNANQSEALPIKRGEALHQCLIPSKYLFAK